MIAAIDCRIDEETSAPLYNFVVLAANDGTSQHVLAQFSTMDGFASVANFGHALHERFLDEDERNAGVTHSGLHAVWISVAPHTRPVRSSNVIAERSRSRTRAGSQRMYGEGW